MNYRTFNRYELFTSEMMSNHMELIVDIQRYQMEMCISDYQFINSLYGIWDGYLYSNLLTSAMEYPPFIYERVLDTYRLIDEWIEEKEYSI